MNGVSSIASFGRSTRTASARRVSATSEAICRFADQLAWLTLATVVFVVPLMMAGLKETGILVFVSCSALLSIAWAVGFVSQPSSGTPFTSAIAVGLLAIATVALQIVPLPRGLLHALSPFADSHLAAWATDGTILRRSWTQISMTPGLTKSGLVLLVGYFLYFATLLQLIRTEAAIDRVLRLIAASTVVMTGIALSQLFFGNGMYLWFIEYPFRPASWPAKGTFTNQNHLAQFLALGIGPLVWWWKCSGRIDGKNIRGRVSNQGFGVKRNTESHQQAIAGALAIVLLTGVLTFSRGGIAAVLLVSAISFFAAGFEIRTLVRLAVPIASFMCIGVVLFGTEMLEAKWNRLAEAESFEDVCRGRFLLWQALLEAVPWFWPLGSGVGSHAEVYPIWMSTDIGKRLSHAESGYLQILIETGVTGITLLGLFFVLVAHWFVKAWKTGDEKTRARALVIFAGLLASACHSIADFVWYIPACLIQALTLAACLCRQSQISSEAQHGSNSKTVRPRWPVIWATILVVGLLPVGKASAGILIENAGSETPWLAYRKLAIGATTQGAGSFDSLEGVDDQLDEMVRQLELCLQSSPGDYRVRCELAGLYLRRFEKQQLETENPVSINEIRNTVNGAGFESPKAVAQWLQRAFGNNVVDLYRALELARSGAVGQPLRGENYLILSQLSFLLLASDEENVSLLDQAISVRPFSTHVLYYLGLRTAEQGDLDSATEYWKTAFHRDPNFRSSIVASLGPYLAPHEIIAKLDAGLLGGPVLFRFYDAQKMSEEKSFIAEWYRDEFAKFAAEKSVSDHQFWAKSEPILSFAGDTEGALYCLAKASAGRPQSYHLRKRYGFALYEAAAIDAARKELEWCRLRNPDDREITDAIAAISKSIRQEVAHDFQ